MCHASLRRQNRCNHDGSNTVSTSHNFNIAPKRGSSKGYLFDYSSNLVLFGSTTVHCRFVEMFLGRIRWLRGGKEKQGWQSLNFRMDISGLSGRGLEEKVPIFAASFSWAWIIAHHWSWSRRAPVATHHVAKVWLGWWLFGARLNLVNLWKKAFWDKELTMVQVSLIRYEFCW